MKWIKRIGIVAGILLLLGAVSAWIIASIYEDQVKKYLISELEKELTTDVRIESLNLSLLDKFPYASLRLSEVLVYEKTFGDAEADTLAYLNQVYLQFNIWGLFEGDYSIEKITAESGFLHASIDEKGRDNFRVWKTSEEEGQNFLIELQDVALEEVHFEHQNEMKGQLVGLFIQDLQFSGAFSKDQYSMEVAATTDLEIFKSEDAVYGENNRLEVAAVIEIDRVQEEYRFSDGRLAIDEIMDFALAGKVYPGGTDLEITGQELPILSVKNLLPNEWRTKIDPYKSQGVLDLHATITEAFSRSKNPHVAVEFGVKEGAVTHAESGMELKKLSLSGSFDNGKKRSVATSVLSINHLKGQLGSGSLEGQLQLTNLSDPYTDTRWTFALGLPELNRFFDLKDLHDPAGRLEGEIAFAGRWKNPETLTRGQLDTYRTSGEVTLREVAFRWADYPLPFTMLNGHLGLTGQDLVATDISVDWGPNPINLEGRIPGFLPWVLLPDQNLAFHGNVAAGVVDLEALLAAHAKEGAAPAGFALPNKLTLNTRLELEGLTYKKFNMNDLYAKVTLGGGTLKAERLQLEAAGGQLAGSMTFEAGVGTGFGLTAKGDLAGMDIQELFRQFDNFGNQTIRHDHLRGSANAQIDFFTEVDTLLNIQKDRIRMDAAVAIQDGELINLEAMDAIAETIRENTILNLFIKVDPLAEDLRHIKFKTLENELSIRNNILFIPQMSIRSSAVDIDLEGSHTFDNEIDYKLSFQLAEVLSTKTRRSKQEYNYIEDEADGRTRVYMSMSGTVEDPIIKFERIKFRTTFLKEEIQQEKNTVKSLLKEEFGFFKNDTTVKALPEEPTQDVVTSIEWEDAEQPKEEAAPKKERKGLKGLLGNRKPKKKKSAIETGEWDDEEDDY